MEKVSEFMVFDTLRNCASKVNNCSFSDCYYDAHKQFRMLREILEAATGYIIDVDYSTIITADHQQTINISAITVTGNMVHGGCVKLYE